MIQVKNWSTHLRYDPIAPLLSSGDAAIAFFVKRDLLNDRGGNVESLWALKDAQKIIRRQQENGSWVYPSGRLTIRSQENYNQIETYRNLGYLVEMYGFNKRSPVIKSAAEYLFSFQTDEGDIRGIYGSQYTPNYTAAILELLIKAGYGNDKRIEKAFQWLISIRQNDGGWAIPLRTCNTNLDIIGMGNSPLQPNKNKPFSHMVTGVVLRAFAAHKVYRNSKVAKKAAGLLLQNLFEKDNYSDRGTTDFWLRFTFPFWFTDLISAMDSLSQLGVASDEPKMADAINWFIDHQQKDGLWKLKVLKNKQLGSIYWMSHAICRVMKRLYH